MQKIKAKFKVQEITKNEYGERVQAAPVTSGDGDNADYSEATPAGDLTLYVTNKAAFGFFVPGEEYYLEFTCATGE